MSSSDVDAGGDAVEADNDGEAGGDDEADGEISRVSRPIVTSHSTFRDDGIRGPGWTKSAASGDDMYTAMGSGIVYNTRTTPPPGKCYECWGRHWRKDCPSNFRRRVLAIATM